MNVLNVEGMPKQVMNVDTEPCSLMADFAQNSQNALELERGAVADCDPMEPENSLAESQGKKETPAEEKVGAKGSKASNRIPRKAPVADISTYVAALGRACDEVSLNATDERTKIFWENRLRTPFKGDAEANEGAKRFSLFLEPYLELGTRNGKASQADRPDMTGRILRMFQEPMKASTSKGKMALASARFEASQLSFSLLRFAPTANQIGNLIGGTANSEIGSLEASFLKARPKTAWNLLGDFPVAIFCAKEKSRGRQVFSAVYFIQFPHLLALSGNGKAIADFATVQTPTVTNWKFLFNDKSDFVREVCHAFVKIRGEIVVGLSVNWDFQDPEPEFTKVPEHRPWLKAQLAPHLLQICKGMNTVKMRRSVLETIKKTHKQILERNRWLTDAMKWSISARIASKEDSFIAKGDFYEGLRWEDAILMYASLSNEAQELGFGSTKLIVTEQHDAAVPYRWIRNDELALIHSFILENRKHELSAPRRRNKDLFMTATDPLFKKPHGKSRSESV